MSAFNTSKSSKKINPLDRAIKKNPKYDYVQSTLDTGSSLTKYMKRVDEIKTNYRYQQDEIFKRMKITTFVQLLLQVAEIDSIEKDSRMNDFESVRSIRTMDSQSSDRMSHRAEVLAEMSEQSEEKNHHHEYNNNNNNHSSTSPVPSLAFTDRSSSTINSQMNPNHHPTLQKLVRGIGELDAYDSEARRRFERAERRLHELQQDADLPYLLLDLRDRDDYDACHIISALSYPIAMLSRSINNETPDMLAYKNQEGKIIVIYDDDERIGTKAATTLVQRGYDNLFLLSGGLKLASKKFPDGLLTGTEPYVPPPSVGGTSRSSVRTAVSTTSSYMSSASKKTFDRDDIEKLSQQLDANLMPNDRFNRLSKSSRATNDAMSSKASVASSTRTLTSIHEKPWKPY